MRPQNVPGLFRGAGKRDESLKFDGFVKSRNPVFLHLMISMSYENEIVRFGTFYEFIILVNGKRNESHYHVCAVP